MTITPTACPGATSLAVLLLCAVNHPIPASAQVELRGTPGVMEARVERVSAAGVEVSGYERIGGASSADGKKSAEEKGGGGVGGGRSYQGLSMPGFFGCQIRALAMRRMLSSSSLICLRSSIRFPAHCSLVLRLLMTT